MHMWNNYTTVKTYIPQFEQKFQSWGKYTTIRTLHHSWDIYSSEQIFQCWDKYTTIRTLHHSWNNNLQLEENIPQLEQLHVSSVGTLMPQLGKKYHS